MRPRIGKRVVKVVHAFSGTNAENDTCFLSMILSHGKMKLANDFRQFQSQFPRNFSAIYTCIRTCNYRMRLVALASNTW